MSKFTRFNFTIWQKFYQEISYQAKWDFWFPPVSPFFMMVDFLFDNIDLSHIANLYKSNSVTGGRPFYSPKQLMKILVAAVANNFSFRKIIHSIKNDDVFKWFARDFNGIPSIGTLSHFYNHLDNLIEDIFVSTIRFMQNFTELDLAIVYVDATTFKAYNNRYDFFSQAKLKRKIDELEAKISSTKEKNEREVFISEIQKCYEIIEELGARASCGKNDFDASLLKDKQKHFIVGYNLQVIVENELGLAVGFYPTNNASDNVGFIELLENFIASFNKPSIVIADSIYGNEEIYSYLKKNNITALIKSKNSMKMKEDRFTIDDFNPSNDKGNPTLICPNNRVLVRIIKRTRSQKTGFESLKETFKSDNCDECEFALKCLTERQENKIIETSINLINFRKEAYNSLMSEEGIRLYKERFHKNETVFGYIKQNLGREFRRTSTPHISTEFYLKLVVFNIKRIVAFLQKNQLGK